MLKKILIALMGLLAIASAWSQQDYIPPRAYEHRDTIKKELDGVFPSIPRYNYIPALIEHESCVTLRSKKCWSSLSQLKTQREEGAGLGMLTRAYNKDGSIRFDSLKDMRTRYRKDLGELDWNTIYQRPDIQIKAMILMVRESYNKLYDIENGNERLAMTDSAYNGGIGGLLRERRQCSLTKGCNSKVWFGNVANHCLKSKKPLYGNRSACDISRHHVVDVMQRKLPKYERAGYLPL